MWHLIQAKAPMLPILCLLLCYRPYFPREVDATASSMETSGSHRRKEQMSPNEDSPFVPTSIDVGRQLHPQTASVRFESFRWNLSEGRKDGMIYSRRNPDAPNIDYAGSHPYEILERRRRLSLLRKKAQSTADSTSAKNNAKTEQTKWYTKTHDFWFDPDFILEDFLQDDWYDADDDFDPSIMYDKVDDMNDVSAEDKVNWDNFRPIRIHVDTRFLDESVTDERKDEFIEYYVLPAAVQFWSKALMVYPVKRLFVDNNYCKLGNPSHFANGLNDADLVLYVSSSNDCSSGGSYVLAGADACDWDQFDRPIGGQIKFCYDAFPLNSNGKASPEITRIMVEVAIHEIGHVLGLRANDLAFYYDRVTGLPRTPRPVIPSNDTKCITGQKSSEIKGIVYKPHTTTLRLSAIKPGIQFYEIVTPTVKRVARNHFNCPSMTGMRLENQPTGESCFGEHWEERLSWEASMSAIKPPALISEHISPLTLALLEDSGWYRANYQMSKAFGFGHGAGCDFVEKPCVVNGTLPDYAKPYFCVTTGKEDSDAKCDPTHTMMAFCDLYDLSKISGEAYPPVPQVYRYFSNPAMGPKKTKQADFCPMYSEELLYCTRDPRNSARPYAEESWAPGSRCYNSNSRPFCFETLCDEVENKVMVKVGDEIVTCEFDGQRIDAPFAGESIYFECPKKAVVCPDLICPSSCSGNGDCDWESESCICDGEIQTEDCNQFNRVFGEIGFDIEGVDIDQDIQLAGTEKSSSSTRWTQNPILLIVLVLSSIVLILYAS